LGGNKKQLPEITNFYPLVAPIQVRQPHLDVLSEVLDDHLIMDLQPSHFVPVLKPKIDGTLPGHPTVAFCKSGEIESSRRFHTGFADGSMIAEEPAQCIEGVGLGGR